MARIWRGVRSSHVLEARTNLAWDIFLPAAEHGSGPLHVRLTGALRDAIRQGRIQVGSALPPSRQLAADLGCSRWAVTEAYEQLVAEGYLQARIGSGTRVRGRDHRLPVPRPVVTCAPELPRFDLAPGLPDLAAFPRGAWSRAWRSVIATVPHAELSYPPRGGHPRLRLVLADYLQRVRGAVVKAEDVTITASILDGVTRVGRTLVSAGHHRIAVEDPCWRWLRQGVQRSGLEVAPIAVDGEGMRTDELPAIRVRAAIAAPAHQFPTGTVLTPARRAALVEWAEAADGLILEDDYDAEFRYDRRPVGTVQGTDPDHTALFGSLSKTLGPGLRLGWTVTPPRWTEALRSEEPPQSGPSILDQLTLARFIETGAYDRHLRALRRRYRARRDRFASAVARHLPGLDLSGAAAGLHVLLSLPSGLEGGAVAAAARMRGVRVVDLGACRFYGREGDGRGEAWRQSTAGPSEALVLGYGNLDDGAVEEAVAELARAIRTVQSAPMRR